MKFAYDFHIHSVLSPCADVLMTPNNILNMALLQELDFVAVTDHNSLKQVDVLLEISSGLDVVFVPGCECEVSEGFHVVALFRDLLSAHEMDQFLESHLPKEVIDEAFYGEQVLTDLYDEECEHYPYLLLKTLDVDYMTLYKKVKELSGVVVLAHIDKARDGSLKEILSRNLPADAIEITKNTSASELLEKHPVLKNYRILSNSDAHQIYEINERKYFVELKDKTIESLFDYLEGK